jgi:hypothetical protein
LGAKGGPANINIQTTQGLLVLHGIQNVVGQHNQARARAKDRQTISDGCFEWLEHAKQSHQFVHDRRLSAGND